MRGAIAAIETNWGAIAVRLVLAAPAVGAVASGLRAPDTLQSRYGEDRRRTRAVIQGDRIVPILGGLIFDLQQPPSDLDDDEDDNARKEAVQARLQKTDYMNPVEDLSTLAADYRDLHRFQDEAERWSRDKAIASAISLLAFVYPAVVASIDGIKFPRLPLILAAFVAGLAAAFAVTFFIQEMGSRNRLRSDELPLKCSKWSPARSQRMRIEIWSISTVDSSASPFSTPGYGASTTALAIASHATGRSWQQRERHLLDTTSPDSTCSCRPGWRS